MDPAQLFHLLNDDRFKEPIAGGHIAVLAARYRRLSSDWLDHVLEWPLEKNLRMENLLHRIACRMLGKPYEPLDRRMQLLEAERALTTARKFIDLCDGSWEPEPTGALQEDLDRRASKRLDNVDANKVEDLDGD